ncbi:neural proliferation differentiation and control protein 1-like isoform X3 [Lepidochelys kempii]|uniref:neural proliferation differentiation and control protein 1-like isoform X3 n=1 Tax=Lepidochelys kempii TaxID=8472 RepID=UPI003C6FC9DE
MRTLRWLAALAALLGLGLAPGAGGEAVPAGPAAMCPPRIRLNCLLQRRKGCGPGGIRSCGPCIRPYREDPGGDCVLETPHRNEDAAKGDAGPVDLATLIRSLVAKKQKGSRTPGTETPQQAGSMGIEPQVPSVTETPPTSPPPPTTPPSAKMPSSSPPRPEEDLNSAPPDSRLNEAVSLLLVLMCSVTGVSGVLVAALCWYRNPPKPVQQLSTESETENGDFTVYECPGLAPSGEMEIHNPLFNMASARQRCPP